MLGQYPAVGLGIARAERDRINEQAKAGKNPTLERQIGKSQQAADQVTTFRSIAAELIEIKARNGLSPKYKKKIEGIFRSCLFPDLGDLPIQVVSSPMVKEALKRIEERGKLDLMNDARRLSGEVFNLAKANGQFVGDNPAERMKSRKEHRIPLADQAVAHGFRATFRTYAEESGEWMFDAMEAALAHGKKNATVASNSQLEIRERFVAAKK